MKTKITLDDIVLKFSSYTKNADVCYNGDIGEWSINTLIANDGTQLSRTDLEAYFEQDAVEFILNCCNMAELAIIKAIVGSRGNPLI